ncbi:MAG: fatty acid desaturase family protein [Proteobacteria bacterium]|nr:fatty acid desaturase family protein [Pseudomonadota bacterium]
MSDRVLDTLSREELDSVLTRSDLRAAGMVISNFAIIALAFALPVLMPDPLTMVLAAVVSLLLLGGRQLGLAVIYHDCAHSVFFKTRWLNDLVGHWICGGLVNTSMYAYRTYHLKHHRFAGTTDDPDLQLALSYPASRQSFRRKVIRDLTGQTGLKSLKAQLRSFKIKRNAPFVLTHVLLFAVLAAAGAWWAYFLWWLAYLFVYQMITRMRFMGEHGVALDRLSDDARENTSTTLVSWWERTFIAPNYVNFHLEHHLQAGVPCYNLTRFHRMLRERGFFGDKACFSNGYVDVLRKAQLPA